MLASRITSYNVCYTKLLRAQQQVALQLRQLVVGDDPEVADRRELRAAGEAVAVHLGDNRLRQLPDRPVSYNFV